MLLGIITLLTAFLIAGVAAWFSIAGLMSIFSASALAIAIMAGSLEVGKLVSASWLYRNWGNTGLWLKSYLTGAVIVLMLITSLGIFGYLSKAHLDQAVPTGDVTARIEMIDDQIQLEQSNIDANKKALAQMDAQVDQALGRTTDLKGANRAVQIRRQQASERKLLQADITKAQTAMAELRKQRAPIAGELRKVESEVGPIKYIAALIYGDNPDTNLLERAVRWMIILLVIVFDPLAVVLLIAANKTLAERRNPVATAPLQKKKKAERPTTIQYVDRLVEVPGPERIVEVEKTVERIVEVPVETIIERMVEVPVVDNKALERFRAENQGLRFKIDNLQKQATRSEELTSQIKSLEDQLLTASQPQAPVVEYQDKIVEKIVEVDRPADLRRAAALLSGSTLNTQDLSTDQIYDILQKSSEEEVKRKLGFWAIPLPKNNNSNEGKK